VTAFLVVGVVGIVLLVLSLVAGDHVDSVHGLFDVGGDWFSGAALAGFLGALGFVGALAYDASGSVGVGILVGIVAGIAIGAAVAWAMTRLKNDDDGSTVRSAELVWREGTVVSAIPDDGYGEISVVVAGHLTKLNARAPEALPAGTPVLITGVLSPTSVSVESR
jgi:membrane protein implicated in regulation of membrane protease activity